MDSQIEIKELQPQATITLRDKVNRSALSQVLAELLPQAVAHLEKQGREPSGPPFVRYHSSRNLERVEVDVEVGYPVTEAVEPDEGTMVAGKLPGGPALVTRYVGDYDGSFRAYEALEEWIKANDAYEASSAPWENYLVAPEAADEDGLQLEIVYPLQRVDEKTGKG